MSDTRRDKLLEYVEKEFIGPDPIDWPGVTQSNGEEILVTDPPRIRYIAGILYPNETTDAQVDGQDRETILIEETETKVSEDVPERRLHDSGEDYLEQVEELINRSNAYRQSAISLTVAVREKDKIFVEVSAGTYKCVKVDNPKYNRKDDTFYRSSIVWKNNEEPLTLPNANQRLTKIAVGHTGLLLDIAYRYRDRESLVYTFTLENGKINRGNSTLDEDCFFQVKFKLCTENGFMPLSDGQRITTDEDYLSNQLLYRNIHNYAIGHGCAADWDEEEPVTWISTAIFPKYDIKPIVPKSIKGVSLEMYKMSPYGNFDEAINELYLMCKEYREWINGLRVIRAKLDNGNKITADRHIINCENCLSRMEEGVELLVQNEKIRTAFQYMNLAMLEQQLHYNLPLQRWENDGNGKLYLGNPVQMPDVHDPETWGENKKQYGKWRPFQLAFILMNLRSMYDRDCSERGIVDLIWFPTGGGKTEAYLGLSAYTIFIRKLLNKSDNGTAILMRYTLRLLTAQQYERASAMVCACEKIRRENIELFGTNRITIGLWVGSSTTPNTVKDAVDKYNDLLNNKTNENPFIILKCPWCGAQMGVVQKNEKLRALQGYQKDKSGPRTFTFAFRCSNDACDFSKENLPMSVVDDMIYKNPPTLLLGTVDKFAMLPFRPEARKLFGYENGVKVNSPDLIIQDELHLISGPLGSMVGLYETLIHELCTTRTDSGEIHPKIIASTATISRAKKQCHALYGCGEENVFQFPPSGLDAGDSFFAEEDKGANGRRYIGIMATGSSSDATTAIRLFASLLYGAKELPVEDESERDPYWTNIGYYNSIRELGQAETWIRADIDQHLDVMYKRRYADKRYKTREEYRANRRYIWRDKELTSRVSGSEVTESLADLSISYPPVVNTEGKAEERPIDICLATNMISVGLDVSRLGLMTVVGQPKTTSEYIQATSRVGRRPDKAPGIVFVLYRPGRPRDKSHYEHFRSYHSKMYCNVEPTSVTPFAAPVRDRVLHAVMIGMMRLEGKDSFNTDPPRFPDDTVLEHVYRIIEGRIDKIDPDELQAAHHQMEEIFQRWEAWNPLVWEAQKDQYGSYTEAWPLMYSAGSHPNENWGQRGLPTPTSMRNVDASCEAYVLPNGYMPEEE